MTSGAGELRQDVVTGKWVAIAPGRSKRPHHTSEGRAQKNIAKYQTLCPFCNLAQFPQEPDVLRLPDDPHDWQVHIFPNKYPAFTPARELKSWQVGPYRTVSATGYHELLVPRWHNQIEGLMTEKQFSLQLEALVLRYRQLRTEPAVNYIQIIKNHGHQAGGSLEHPHHQIFAIPVLPEEAADLLHGAEVYAKKYSREVFADIIDFERAEGQRVIAENDHFIAICPYASRQPYEVTLLPHQPNPHFEDSSPDQREALAELMRRVFSRLYHGLYNPPYNYYIYSAPCDDTGFVCNRESFKHWRWHIEIVPRLTSWGGFEMSTGLEINSVAPEHAAAFYRGETEGEIKVGE